jgi:O-antigen/teichoic acid export membrane protein
MVCVLLPVVVIGVAVAPEVLRVFGQSYANHGTTLLRMLLLSLPSFGVNVFYFSFALLDKRIWWTAIRQTVSAVVFFVVLFLLLNHFKILAIGIATLIESGLLALFFLPILIRRYRLAVRPAAAEPDA